MTKSQRLLEIERIALAANARSRILLRDDDPTDNRKRCYLRYKESFWNNPDYPSPTPAILRRFPTGISVKE